MREMKLGELLECRLAFRLRRPHDLEAIDKRKTLLDLVKIAGVLHEIHHHEARNTDVGIRREPIRCERQIRWEVKLIQPRSAARLATGSW